MFRYDKKYSDPYFNTREQTFLQHLLYLMSRWVNPVNVYFLPPVRKLPEESSVQFSERVKELISNAAGLKNLSWDGYLKNYRPSREKQDKMRLETRQQYLNELSAKIEENIIEDPKEISESETVEGSPNLPDKDYLPDWLSEDERMIVQNTILQENCPCSSNHNDKKRSPNQI